MSNETVATPAITTVAVADVLPYQFDFTAPMAQLGGSISSVATSLTDLSTGASVTAPSGTISGNLINLTMTGSVMTAGHSYRLEVVITTSGGSKDATSVTVNVPF